MTAERHLKSFLAAGSLEASRHSAKKPVLVAHPATHAVLHALKVTDRKQRETTHGWTARARYFWVTLTKS